MKFFTREVKIGLTGIIALALLFVGLNFLKGINLFKSTQTYYVSFANAKGLAKSSPVYADGYNIGIVRDVHYDLCNPGKVIVEIEVENGLRIPAGSSAELVSEMLGGCTMNLLLTTNPRERVAPGDTLVGSENQGLMDKASTLVPQVDQILNKVDTLISTLNTLASNKHLPLILENAEQLTGNLTQTTAKLNRILEKDVPQLTQTFNTAGNNVVQLTDKLNQLDLQATLNRVDNSMEQIELLTQKLNRKDNTLGLLLNDTALYNQVNGTINSANNLLIDMKERPGRYIHFSVFGRKAK